MPACQRWVPDFSDFYGAKKLTVIFSAILRFVIAIAACAFQTKTRDWENFVAKNS
jgi:hypothetical protein